MKLALWFGLGFLAFPALGILLLAVALEVFMRVRAARWGIKRTIWNSL